MLAHPLGSAQGLAAREVVKVEHPRTGVDAGHIEHGFGGRLHPGSDHRFPVRPT